MSLGLVKMESSNENHSHLERFQLKLFDCIVNDKIGLHHRLKSDFGQRIANRFHR